jgi:resuscitation-promoting factor RpfB
MSGGQKAAIWVSSGVAALLLLCCGGATIVNAFNGKPTAGSTTAGDQQTVSGTTAPATTAPEQVIGDPTTSPPVVEKKQVTEAQEIAFSTRNVNDSSLAKGTKKVRTKGVPGAKTVTYEVTYTDGVETGRTVVSEKITKQPVTQVVAIGTKAPPPTKPNKCDPNYSGCVPIASDVDCAGGSGNGPAYVQGPVQVIGTDIYHLDSDNDGTACEKN